MLCFPNRELERFYGNGYIVISRPNTTFGKPYQGRKSQFGMIIFIPLFGGRRPRIRTIPPFPLDNRMSNRIDVAAFYITTSDNAKRRRHHWRPVPLVLCVRSLIDGYLCFSTQVRCRVSSTLPCMDRRSLVVRPCV